MPEPNESVELASEAVDECGDLCPRPPMKHSDTKDSISSNDSDISLSYDSPPFVPKCVYAHAADDEDQRDDEEGANLADLSDTGSENGSVPEKESVQDKPEKDEKKEEEETPFVPPDDELVERIIQQVEFYFSDVNITKDAFLLKHVKRNKEGYVSLKLISSFKRVKHIAKDWRVVAYALAKSKKLQINEAGTKLRRVDPLPAYDQTTPSRTVVAINLPLDKPTIENVAEMFRNCGEIALIRILRPGNPIPADVRHFVNKHPEMNGTVSALVEFVRTESAHNAINRQEDWRNCEHGMKVIELNAPPSSDRKKRTANNNKKNPVTRLFDSEYSSSCASGSEAEDMRHRMRMQRRCSSPHLVRSNGDHWTQRRWSRDSGSDSPGSNFSRSRSNSGVFYVPDHIRRMSAGWDSGSDSYSSNRSRSNSGVSIPDGMRRYSLISKESDCCCCNHYTDCNGRRMSLGKDSGSEGYCSNRSRCNSGASDIHRKDSGEYYYQGRYINDRRVSLCKESEGFCNRSRTGSNASMTEPIRRISSGREPESDGRMMLSRQRSSGGILLPENIVRMPRGPDGGRGFIAPAPACHTLVE